MSKYKNKDCISLNYDGDDSHKVLVREVITEAIRILNSHVMSDSQSKSWAIDRGINFLETNFDINNEERSDEWRIEQFNRNRDVAAQVSTKEEMEKKVKKKILKTLKHETLPYPKSRDTDESEIIKLEPIK